MNTISNAELALLSLLAEKPRHAYDIEQVIEARNIRDWTDLGFSSIYRLLTKLEKRNLLEGKMAPPEGRGPARKIYHLTKEGRRIWQMSALENLANPDRKYSSFLLALDNLCALPKKEALLALRKYLKDQKNINDHLTTSVKNHPMINDFYISSFFSYLINQQLSEIKWLEAFIEQYELHTSGV